MTQLTSDQRHILAQSGLHFLRTIGEVYGSERAMEMWDKLADAVEPDLKGWVWSAMLGGSELSTFVITGVMPTATPVSVIKAIRVWDRRNLGLKEAKDMWDALKNNGLPITVEVSFERRVAAAAEFRNIGCIGLGL